PGENPAHEMPVKANTSRASADSAASPPRAPVGRWGARRVRARRGRRGVICADDAKATPPRPVVNAAAMKYESAARGVEVQLAKLQPVRRQLLVHLGERGGAEVLDAHEFRFGARRQVAQGLHTQELERLADADGEVDVGHGLAQRALAAALERLEE